ncbi:YncE family protein [Methylomagnum sp.]
MVRYVLIVVCCLLSGFAALPASAATPFIGFESGPVRPLALSPDGSRLFAANTPDNRLEIFAITAEGLTHQASVPVGDMPHALAVSPDRGTVYAAVFFSGNQTTTVSPGAVCPGFGNEPCVISGVEYWGGGLPWTGIWTGCWMEANLHRL